MKFSNKIRMKSIIAGYVVEFESETCGTIVALGDPAFKAKVGYYTSSWCSCYDTTVWTPYRNPYRILGSKWRHQ